MVEDKTGSLLKLPHPTYYSHKFFNRKMQRNRLPCISWCHPATGIYKHQQAEDLRTGKRTKEDTIGLSRSIKVQSPRAVVESSKKDGSLQQ